MQIIKTEKEHIEVGSINASRLKNILDLYSDRKIVVLVDENTENVCWPLLLTHFDALRNAELIVVPTGEGSKSLEIAYQLWSAFSNYNIQRKDLIINLGGGVVTDLGGFIASTYKRGIDFINIPTSLLAMVDASVGGKTGINLDYLKNQIGVFALPKLVVCDPAFLETLPDDELLSGKAEILKHGLIADRELWQDLSINFNGVPIKENINRAIQIKTAIVASDFEEKGERKKLNFGHTVGHAIEGLLLSRSETITHGIAVAWGMVVESWLSWQVAALSKEEYLEIKEKIHQNYPKLNLKKTDCSDLIEWMKKDKKNEGEKVNFTLLEQIGRAKINVELHEEIIIKALNKNLI